MYAIALDWKTSSQKKVETTSELSRTIRGNPAYKERREVENSRYGQT